MKGYDTRPVGICLGMTPIRSAARTLLGALFVGSGWVALRHPERLAVQAKPVTDRLAPTLTAAGLPTDPATLVKATGAIHVAGGLALVTGHFTRPAATLLAATVVPATVAAHPFWNEPDPQRRADQQVQFAKNLGLLGGLLFAAVDRGGRPSLAWRARHATRHATRSAKVAGAAGAKAARDAGRTVTRTARTAKREARIAARAARTARALPF